MHPFYHDSERQTLFSANTAVLSLCFTPFWQQQECLFLSLLHSFLATARMLVSHSASLLSGNNRNACFSVCFTPFWQQQECLFLTLLHSFLATTGMLVSHSASLFSGNNRHACFVTLLHSFMATTVILVSHSASLLFGNNSNAHFSLCFTLTTVILCFTLFWQQQ